MISHRLPGYCSSSRFTISKTGRNLIRQTMIESLESRILLTYAAPTSYNIGTQPDGFVPNAAPINVVTADFNHDGKLDLIVAHKADNSLYFLKGIGNGKFRPAVQIPVGEGIEGRMFVGDFNNDGKLDLFLPGANNQAIILLGNGDGTFKPRVDSSSFSYPGYYPRGWVVGDFNGDGNLDVASTLPSNTADAGRYIVLLGNGDGTFKPGIVGPAGQLHYSRWAVAADLNHDGKLDLVVADGQGTSVQTGTVELSVLFGNGDGTFTLGGHYASPQLPDGSNTAATANPEDVVLADVNGDGKLDAIESDYDNTINVFLGNGDGTFQAAKSFAPGNYPRDVVPVDVNHDGKIDLVVTNVGINQGGALFATEGAEPGSVAILLGNGDGTFQAPITYSPSVYPGWTAVGDFNHDGLPDLAVTQVLDGHAVNVMLNQRSNHNLPPTFAQSPSASPNPVTGKTVTLSALGADDHGESKLKYTWSTVGPIPAGVTFSINGKNAAKNTIATFSKTGTYLFQCTITDTAGLSIMDLVTVTVNQGVASLTLTPGTASVAEGATQQFTATAFDQFGNAITTRPPLSWNVNGGGTISSAGLFTAGTAAGGPFTVSVSSGTVLKTASLTVTGGSSTGGTLNVFSLPGDGRVRYFGAPGIGLSQWDVAHDATAGNEADPLLANRANWAGTGALFGPSSTAIGVDVMRGYLAFDTSALPANAIITSATLGVFITGKLDSIPDGNDFITIVQGLQASGSTLSTGDFSKAGDAIDHPTEGSNRVTIPSMTTNGYVQWNLNSTGLNWITKGGITKLAAHEGHDVLDLWPNYASGQADVISAIMSEQPGTSQDPYLRITYTLPPQSAAFNNPLVMRPQ